MEMVGRASLSQRRFLVLTLSLGFILVMYVLGTVGVGRVLGTEWGGEGTEGSLSRRSWGWGVLLG